MKCRQCNQRIGFWEWFFNNLNCEPCNETLCGMFETAREIKYKMKKRTSDKYWREVKGE